MEKGDEAQETHLGNSLDHMVGAASQESRRVGRRDADGRSALGKGGVGPRCWDRNATSREMLCHYNIPDFRRPGHTKRRFKNAYQLHI